MISKGWSLGLLGESGWQEQTDHKLVRHPAYDQKDVILQKSEDRYEVKFD